MCGRHRKVDKKRVVPVPLHEVEDVVGEHVVAVLAFHPVQVLTVLVNDRVLVAGALFLGVMRVPHAVLIEPGVLDPLAF